MTATFRNIVKFKLTLLTIFFLNTPLQAQLLDYDQEPPSVKWKSIKTKHFDLIYPSVISKDAQRAANLLEHIYEPEIRTMDYPFKRLPIMLSTQSVISNGYVTLAPRRSEWYGTPPQIGSDDGDWYELLATHEMRHVAQFGKLLNRGLNKYAWGILGGETLPLVINSFLIPRWFWEGDAVLIETLFSKGGRGRKPDFDMGIRANLLSKERFTYYKSMLGSYTDFVPNPYPLGYLIVSHARKFNGPLLWSNVLGRSSWFSFFPFGFSAALKGLSGQNVAETYDSTMDEFQWLWEQQRNSLQFSACEYTKQKVPSAYTNYLYPQQAADGTIYSLKTGLADAPKLVSIDVSGNEKTLATIAPMYKISVNREMVAWTSYKAHWRWGKQNYSNIILFDSENGRKKTIRGNGKYFTPVLSPDNDKIAAVEYTTDRKSRIVILDTETGQVLSRLPNPQNKVIKTPAWSSDGNKIVFTSQSAAGKSLCIYNLNNDQSKVILFNTWLGITQPVFWKNYILFSSGYSGIDNIYALDTETGQPYQVTSRPFGAFNPSVAPESDIMLFNDYNANGYQIARMQLVPGQWTPIEEVTDRSLNYFSNMLDEEQGGNILGDENLPHLIYDEHEYSTGKHLFNFHSWEIYPDSINMGVRFLSNDILNTTALGIGAFYNRNEKSLGYILNLSYGRFYPVIDFNVQRLHRAVKYRTELNKTKTDVWTETSAIIGLRLPVNLSSGIYRQSFSLAAYAQFTDVRGQKHDYQFVNNFNNGQFVPLYYSLNYSHIQSYAIKDVRRQWAQIFDMTYAHTPFEDSINKGAHLFSRLHLYFPGFLRHHSLLFSTDYEWQQPNPYRFQPLLKYPRGYSFKFHNQFINASLDYELPLFYPDFDISAWFYLKRVKVNLFYDYGIYFANSKPEFIRSAGVEILLDHHWFSLPLELEGGYRFSFRQEDQKVDHEIIFRIPLK